MSTPAELWAHRNLIGNLARRDLKARYKKSVLGWLWSLLNPAATLGVFTLVFGVFLSGQAPVAGNGSLKNFALYLFAGLTIWNAFQNSLNGAMGALESSAPLLTKVYFPPECPAIASVAGVLLQAAIESTIIVGIMAIVGNLSWTVIFVPVILVLACVLAIGLGLWLSVLNIRFRDVQYLVGIALQVGFYCTPIVYSPQIIPERYHGVPLRRIMGLNPIARFVQAFRDVVYQLRVPSLLNWLFMIVVPMIILAASWLWFRRAAANVIEEL